MKSRFGAGTLIAIIIALLVGGYSFYQQRVRAARPPVVERQVTGNGPRGIAPTPEFLIRHAQELRLTAAQVKKVTGIASAYRKDIAPVKKQLTIAADQYRQYLQQQQQASRVDSMQLDAHGADVRRLSAVMTTARHAYWRQAKAVLTATQQKTLDALLADITARDLQ
ncbi:MAG: hypothetical protein ACYDBB_19930 [Armatimonadota bacterium]